MAQDPSHLDLLQGTLDLLILRALGSEATHGWAVSERIQQISQDVLKVNQGSLYPALHRLEHRGWIRPNARYLGTMQASALLLDHGFGPKTARDRG